MKHMLYETYGNALSVGGYPILTGLSDMKKSQQ